MIVYNELKLQKHRYNIIIVGALIIITKSSVFLSLSVTVPSARWCPLPAPLQPASAGAEV